MAGAFDIVMNSRRALVEKILDMMKAGYVFTAPEWNRQALRSYNPISAITYKGGNRLRLMAAAIELGYRDPRWMTARQMALAGYEKRPGEKGILCEKWIFERKIKQLNEDGIEETVIKELNPPRVSFFVVYNAEQVMNFPSLDFQAVHDEETMQITERLIQASECPIIEVAQTDAYYDYEGDRIVLPPRDFFKDEVSFVKTSIHEMAHSTGHETRLNRDMHHPFGSEQYAREELRAEIGALFVEADLGIRLEAEHYQDHSNYLASWIKVLKDDPNEFFRACSDAEKINERLMGNYRKRYQIPEPEIERMPIKEMDVPQRKTGRHR